MPLWNVSHNVQFQSRNRGSFGFKDSLTVCMNIEADMFQSRNRGSFGFKRTDSEHEHHSTACFNLVIEVLLVSSDEIEIFDDVIGL